MSMYCFGLESGLECGRCINPEVFIILVNNAASVIKSKLSMLTYYDSHAARHHNAGDIIPAILQRIFLASLCKLTVIYITFWPVSSFTPCQCLLVKPTGN